MLDGLGSIKDDHGFQGYVSRAVELGQTALAITDHGYLLGCPTFYKECRRQGIEPILGEEFYHVDDVAWRPPKGSKKADREGDDDARYHSTWLARGHEGYKVLTKMTSLAHRAYYYKPIIDRKMVEENLTYAECESVVVLSGCATSRLSRLIRAERMEEAAEELMWWRETFPHYYIEVMHHGCDFDQHLNETLIEMARRYDVPIVITNDPHYVVAEDAGNHDALLAIQTASDIDDPNRFRFDGHGYHLRSRAEMKKVIVRHYGEEVWREGYRNTQRIARMCETRIPQWEERTWQIPKYPDVPEGDDAYTHLRRLAWRGLRRRGLRDNPDYANALKDQLKVVKQTGIADFLLITMDLVEYARRNRIPVGPGRGSVCGSLVSWTLGIHKIDPIKYTLRADRFINPARPSMPDIDTDFGKERRGEMFKYAEHKYGADNVVHVCTYGTMRLKLAFQFLAGAYGVEFKDRMRLVKQIEQDEDDPTQFILPAEIEESHPDLHAQLERLAGVLCKVSAHPAGVIIADPAVHLRQQVPEMFIPSSKRFVGQYDLYAAEDTGLMKQDFLGLRALDTIDEAVRLVGWRTGEDLDPDAWVPDEEPGDDEVWRMIRQGRTEGVFQMEGFTNQRGCKAVKPKNFEDVVSVTALYRTGPIKAGFPQRFIDNRQQGHINWSHPALEQFLGQTWGVILYQEQVMDIAQHLAGFDAGQVDDIVKSIKHKDPEKMEKMRPMFMAGCKRTGVIPSEVAKELWDAIEGYSGYSYNRSHAVAYTMTTYQTARLKRHHTVEFIAALLATVPASKDNAEKRESYLREAVRMGIKILPPDINRSGVTAMPNKEGTAIRFGLTDITGVGPKAAAKIVEARPEGGFTDATEVATAVNNAGTLNLLMESNVMRCLGHRGSVTRLEELLRWQLRDRLLDLRAEYEEMLDPPETAHDFDDVCILGEVVSKVPGHTAGGKKYQTWRVRMSPTQTYSVRLWSETEPRWTIPEGSVVLIRGRWEPKWENLGVSSPKMIKTLRRKRKEEAA